MRDNLLSVKSLLRSRGSHEDNKVVYVELFFDLVFVFAITQLAHSLLHHFSLSGIAETAFLMLATWWVWIYTTWVTNWLDPQKTPVRMMLFSQMLAGMFLAIAIPNAFSDMGLIFALAYTFMQLSRCVFMCIVLYKRHEGNFRNFARITVWSVASAVFWLSGGLVEAESRYALWGMALFIDTIAPIVGFWTPKIGKSTTTDWDISGAHLAERCGLLIIIALGESLLVIGHTFSELPWSLVNVSGFLTAFVGSVAMWWIYFNIGAERAALRIESSEDPGYLARLAYTYLHIIIIAGIILVAVSDEFILKHPMGHNGHTDGLTVAAILGGPAVFLLGNLLFKRAVFGKYAKSHITGIVLCLLAAPLYMVLPPLYLAIFASVVMVVVGYWESRTVKH